MAIHDPYSARNLPSNRHISHHRFSVRSIYNNKPYTSMAFHQPETECYHAELSKVDFPLRAPLRSSLSPHVHSSVPSTVFLTPRLTNEYTTTREYTRYNQAALPPAPQLPSLADSIARVKSSLCGEVNQNGGRNRMNGSTSTNVDESCVLPCYETNISTTRSLSLQSMDYEFHQRRDIITKPTIQFSSSLMESSSPSRVENRELKRPSKRSSKKCEVEGCEKIAQTKRRCKFHGGGSRCSYPDCTKSNQGNGLCRAHGGGKRCNFKDCTKGAQRGGFCHNHGGVRFCKANGCKRKDRGAGFCVSHGGGTRCSTTNCNRLARKKRLCSHHYSAVFGESANKQSKAKVAGQS